MKKHVLIFLSLIVCAAPAQTDVKKAALIDSICQVYAKKQMFSGSVLIAKKGKVLLSKGYGMANHSYDIPNSSSTKFKLGSLTKPFTAMAIMILQEKDKLSTDDKLTKYIPDYPNGDKISIHNLLTHTSGIPEHNQLPGFIDTILKMPHTLEEMITLTKNKPLDFEPDSKNQYSNSNYILLTYIIEKASGKKYEEYMKESIFDPLGMKNSGLYDNKDIIKNVAVGYGDGGNELEQAPYMDMSVASGAGAIYSTVDDLFLWDQAFYSEKLVKKTTLEKILTPYKGKSGYGWGITKYADHKLVVKGGALHGFSAIMSRFPDDELCVVFLANVDNYTLFHGPDVSRAIMLDQPYTLPEERKIVKVDKKIYQKLVGVYEMDPGVNIKITIEDNTIFLYYPHGEKTEIFPTSDYTYYIKVANTELQFLRDDKNNITSLRIYGNFAEKICKKIK